MIWVMILIVSMTIKNLNKGDKLSKSFFPGLNVDMKFKPRNECNYEYIMNFYVGNLKFTFFWHHFNSVIMKMAETAS